ncbi:hypothetical protein N7492_007422 [Penicillium capsulatum]|uniref:Lysine-specific metallo-endopeptidase domain-containing protein n=1 Tax=Penicillium capsulatum TaxID=69766 RepID=A0A9W9I3W6_9EURO|nr:hypothetical protein N7492_007422 [Penicillium capsulatum]KAJ6117258.1 hypothetical protein N7512_006983 [Penicillium capsulatum]
MRLLCTGPALLSLGVCLLSQWALADVKATDIFETIPSGQDGTCEGKDVDMMVQEAITLNTKAINALDTLLSKDQFSWFGKEASLGWGAEAMWGMVRKPSVSLGGIGFRFNQEEKKIMTDAREAYQKANQKLKNDHRDDGKLACGGGDWKLAKSWNDLGWDPEDRDDSDGFPADGLYYSEHWAKRDDKQRMELENSILIPAVVDGKDKSPCRPNQPAFMLPRGNLITMCDKAFKNPSLASLVAEQRSWPVGKSIDEIKTPGTIFHHEMMHYVDESIIDVGVKNTRAYKWGNCCYLAEHKKPLSPLKNAQSYTIFAIYVLFDGVKWDDFGKKL